MKIAVHNLKGKKIENMDLNEAVFGVEMNEDLLHQVYVAQEANKRKGLAHTKTRSERSGSTRKPWRQKGTGRARTGSIRNPIWRKGGVTFGPTKERSYAKKVNRKMSQKALKIVLSEKVKNKGIVVVDSFDVEKKKTKIFANALNRLKIGKKALIILLNEEKGTVKISGNIPIVTNIFIDQLSISDILHNRFCVASKSGIEYLQKRLSKGKNDESQNLSKDKE
ncbi:MAG: 50S ribosomal protein L4 [Patescibacteria group bacterium]|nr:50S ribosomal protein L4 [Patescibacteria group bacterium]